MLGRAASLPSGDPIAYRLQKHFHIGRIRLAMPTRADWFRLKAEQCTALARRMTDRTSRQQLEIAAAQWLRLAEDAELLDRIKLARERA
jgi:hypothetical protein